MKTIQIARDIFDFLATKAAETGDSPAVVLRRELGVPEPTLPLEVDDDTYQFILSRSQSVGESASDILRRELELGSVPPGPGPSPAPEPQPEPEPGQPRVLEFRIRSGIGAQPWNEESSPVIGRVGDTLRLINDDFLPHKLHTRGTPFPHASIDILPQHSFDHLLLAPHDPVIDGPLFDHNSGQSAQFWISVSPAS
ncbi:MAG TPA: hypothetical protein VF190_11255 [Rhodothermales bacterium]